MSTRRDEQYHLTPDGVELAIDICEKAIDTFKILINVLRRDYARAANLAFASVDPEYMRTHQNRGPQQSNANGNNNRNARRRNRARRNN